MRLTDAIRRGAPQRHLQRFPGHASLESTRRLHVSPTTRCSRCCGGGRSPQATTVRRTNLSKVGASAWALLDSNQTGSRRGLRNRGRARPIPGERQVSDKTLGGVSRSRRSKRIVSQLLKERPYQEHGGCGPSREEQAS